MPRIKLSDVGLRSLPAPAQGAVDYWDLTLPSFACRVSRGGAKTFILKTHNSRRAIGRWPLISLAEARREAKRLLAEKTLGRIQPQSITVEKARELFLKEKEKARRARTVQDLKDRLERHFDILGACLDSRCSNLVGSDSTLGDEQVFSALEHRSDAASAAECAGLRAERPCLAVYG
ncbi:Arm DNA-binding domain-containing protein [Bradyrhizobium sp. 2S1]|uniref:Arm DNA-binding domain-containing protein n=1 Tax=Bradyrhizobium sp. 2S1 TaxID=1404429 RepID=UPI00140C6D84